jgi:hypothetical protein
VRVGEVDRDTGVDLQLGVRASSLQRSQVSECVHRRVAYASDRQSRSTAVDATAPDVNGVEGVSVGQSSDWSYSRRAVGRGLLQPGSPRTAPRSARRPTGGDIVHVVKVRLRRRCRAGVQVGEDFAMEGMPRAASACGLLP